MRLVLAILLTALLCGCVEVPKDSRLIVPLPPRTEVLAWSGSLRPTTERWADAAEKRFGVRPIVFFAHGGVEDGIWYCYPDKPRPKTPVESVAWLLHDLYPGRMVMLIVCGAGKSLSTPGVIYAKRRVWNYPCPDVEPDENLVLVDGVGDIAEFEVGGAIVSLK